MNINELKSMSEMERMAWFTSANANDLGVVLKNEGVKGVSKMKKAEKLAMIVYLVTENIADEDAKKIMEDTKKLNEEIKVRQSYEETIEATLYARYKNKEITFNELKKVCDAYRVDIPLSCNEENSINIIDEYCNLYSNYEHCIDNSYKYYAILDRNYEWYNLSRKNNMCKEWDWDVKKFYEMNTVNNGYLQLACTFDDNLNYILCVYKNYELLADYVDGSIEDIKRLMAYDDRLVNEDLENYAELIELLNEQQEEYCRIIETDKMLRNKLNCTEESGDFIIDEQNKKIIILNSDMLK